MLLPKVARTAIKREYCSLPLSVKYWWESRCKSGSATADGSPGLPGARSKSSDSFWTSAKAMICARFFFNASSIRSRWCRSLGSAPQFPNNQPTLPTPGASFFSFQKCFLSSVSSGPVEIGWVTRSRRLCWIWAGQLGPCSCTGPSSASDSSIWESPAQVDIPWLASSANSSSRASDCEPATAEPMPGVMCGITGESSPATAMGTVTAPDSNWTLLGVHLRPP